MGARGVNRGKGNVGSVRENGGVGDLPVLAACGSVVVGGWRGQHCQRWRHISKDVGMGDDVGNGVWRRRLGALVRMGVWEMEWVALATLAVR